MDPAQVEPARDAWKMMEEMERGLAGEKSSLPMIPTYLSDDGAIPGDTPAVVIDAGGTNFRRALITFKDFGYRVEELTKRRMPGIERPASWEEFISFTADNIMPLLDRADKVGFCFSFSADVTPEIDGRVQRIDKEVVITGCEGQLVAASLNAELERRGVFGKKIVILNDTVAVLLGGLASVQRSRYSGFVGQVSGTGTNTCCSLPACRIGKLGLDSERSMIVNLESGMYDGIPGGDFDRILDEESHNPGEKHFEKLTAGVYLGELCHLMLKAAADEGLLSPEASERVRALGWIDSAVIDAWASGEHLEQICENEEDEAFVEEICRAMFERSARCMCTNLAAILLLTGAGKTPEKPACICAEGSLVQKGRSYRPVLERLLRDEIGGRLGLFAEYRIGNETTLPGSAAAVLLN
jgi:hexokinase